MCLDKQSMLKLKILFQYKLIFGTALFQNVGLNNFVKNFRWRYGIYIRYIPNLIYGIFKNFTQFVNLIT